ncbi:mannose-6-phosphate isomerase, class I [Erwinia sp. 198]|uniref:mannose-6-phosphate isomerase, class I n=1 Tax=Erwinia sp. 198 TaxID=2022746 RepID=UPI000F6886AA|nr:mannose-6-phosphate isomerase, class I [Erwinia sp. 198]RRZ92988.1 mannose-6-phosphate isomerase, class I [Erwinia sp. 198]
MKKMINPRRHYAWGSKDALAKLFHLPEANDEPVAEIWMGAHPQCSSYIRDEQGEKRSLRTWLAEDPEGRLGSEVARRFAGLPFLFKVLCADKPLSLQAHPDKRTAERGFRQENAAGLPPDAPERNYRDANHKPELLFALTSFKAINGFRQPEEIASLLRPVADIHPEAAAFSQRPDISHLPILSAALLGLTGEAQRQALRKLLTALEGRSGEPWESIRSLARLWPDDNGLFSPLLMNLVTMRPGEAMFLPAGTPHAYLRGAALEVMANSDNVLRAGLTAKHIDLNELLASLRFEPVAANRLLLTPARQGNELKFSVPVDDFAFSIHFLTPEPQLLRLESATIFFCIEGEGVLQNGNGQLRLRPGESCFIAADEPAITLCGRGRLARAGSAIA